MAAVITTLQDRAKTLVEMAEGASFYFVAPQEYDAAAKEKFLTADKQEVLEMCVKHLEQLNDYSHDGVEAAFKAVMEESGLKFGKIGPSVRVALVGGTVSPSIYDVVAVLGKEEVLVRLKKALASLS
jgi:glutamyl-tRNA synthetase